MPTERQLKARERRRLTQNRFIVDGSVTSIECLHKSRILHVLIDTDDFPLVTGYKWSVGENRQGYLFVQSTVSALDGSQRTLRLARHLLGAPSGLMVDHINRLTLDCRRTNLRLVTDAQNRQNLSTLGMGRLRTRGVTLYQGKYIARVTLDGKVYRLGRFSTLDAARDITRRFRAERMPFSTQDRMSLAESVQRETS